MKYKLTDEYAKLTVEELQELSIKFTDMMIMMCVAIGRDEPFDDTGLTEVITLMENTAMAHHQVVMETIRELEPRLAKCKVDDAKPSLHIVKD